jgi:hypothetical protein
MYIKDKQMLVFNLIFDLLWKDWDSLASSVAFLWFRELKYIGKYVAKLLCDFSQYSPEIASILADDKLSHKPPPSKSPMERCSVITLSSHTTGLD